MFSVAIAFCLLVQSQPGPLPARPFVSGSVGGIKAEIRDRKGAPVPGVKILLQHRDGRRWAVLTDEKGQFRAGDLPPGEYQLEWRKEGYESALPQKIWIRANAWLLGQPPGPLELQDLGRPRLHLAGPSSYEYATGAIVPYTRQDIEKIPMH